MFSGSLDGLQAPAAAVSFAGARGRLVKGVALKFWRVSGGARALAMGKTRPGCSCKK